MQVRGKFSSLMTDVEGSQPLGQGGIKEQTEPATENKPVSSTLPGLRLGSCLPVPALTLLHDVK